MTKSRKEYLKTQRLYKQVIFWVALSCAIVMVSVWNHYSLEYNKVASQAIESIKSNIHVQKVKAETIKKVEAQTKLATPEAKESIEVMVDRVIKETNFKWPSYLKRLINCENKRFKGDTLDPKRVGLAVNVPKTSKDRGLLMINDYHQKQITDEQAFDGEWSVRWAIDKINKGGQGIWVCDHKVKANPKYYDNF